MLARGALCRLTADGSKTGPHDVPQLVRLVQRALPMRNASRVCAARTLWRARAVALAARRSIATTAAAVKPTATVKKAVKATAAAKAAPKAATKKAASATKAKPRAAPQKTAAKKPAAKKAAAKKKPAPKKPAPKKRVKKVVTDEDKAKAEIAALRKIALREPVTRGSLNGYNVYIQENSHKGTGHERAAILEQLGALATRFKDLPPAEIERYNHLANEKTAAKRAEYKAWIESHTADEIRLANNARRQLRRKLVNTRKTGHPAHTDLLVDERVPKKPVTPFLQFVTERFASGDYKGITVSEASKLISNEWKALSANEKQKYVDVYSTDRKRYDSELPFQAAA